jgi:hypothetical protein
MKTVILSPQAKDLWPTRTLSSAGDPSLRLRMTFSWEFPMRLWRTTEDENLFSYQAQPKNPYPRVTDPSLCSG